MRFNLCLMSAAIVAISMDNADAVGVGVAPGNDVLMANTAGNALGYIGGYSVFRPYFYK